MPRTCPRCFRHSPDDAEFCLPCFHDGAELIFFDQAAAVIAAPCAGAAQPRTARASRLDDLLADGQGPELARPDSPIMSRPEPRRHADQPPRLDVPPVRSLPDPAPAPLPRRLPSAAGPEPLAWLCALLLFVVALLVVPTYFAVVSQPSGEPTVADVVAPTRRPDPVQPPPPPDKDAPPPAPDHDAIVRASVKDLIGRLDDDDPAQKLRALRDLARLGPDARPAVGALLLALRTDDDDFHREGLRTLDAIGPPGSADAWPLTYLAGDPSWPAGRLYALDALAALGANARPAELVLCTALKDPNAVVRRKAAVALGRIGPEARDAAFRDLIGALRDGDAEVSAAAADALARLGPVTKDDVLTLQILLRDNAPAARRYALLNLTRLGPDGAAAATALEDVLARDAVPELRRLAATALLRARPSAASNIGAFTRALDDADAGVRAEAAAGLAAIGPDHGALPALIVALGHADPAVSRAAQEGITKTKLNEGHVRLLGDALESKTPAVRLKALQVLSGLDAAGAAAVPGLCRLLENGSADERHRAIDVLTAMGPAARDAGYDLAARLSDDDPSVRLDAAAALAWVEAKEVEKGVPLLIGALRIDKLDDLDAVARRDRAGRALTKLGPRAVKALTTALQDQFAGDGPETAGGEVQAAARTAALEILRQIGAAARSPQTVQVLTTVIEKDAFRDVREAAFKARAAIEGE